MIGLIDERHSLTCSARVFLLAAVVSGFALPLSLAMAQEAPANAAKGDVSSWVKICKKDEEGGAKTACLVKYEELDPRTGSVLLTAAIRTIDGEDGRLLIITVPSAYTLVIPAGVEARIDEDKPVSMQFGVCLPTSCQAQTALSEEMLQRMKSGKTLIVAAVNVQGKTMAFPIPLLGFDKIWVGAAVDNSKYEAARYHMLEFAKKTAESQRAAQQPGGKPQARPAPNATTTYLRQLRRRQDNSDSLPQRLPL